MFESAWIETALEIKPSQRRFSHFNRIISDSRKVQPGDLFIAIVGEKMDGHDYALQALSKGASGIIIHKGISDSPISANVYLVSDTLEAYRKLASKWRSKFNIPVIAVTGSVGKTTSKEILTSFLQGAVHSVLKTEGSQNGFVGIPMTLLELRDNHKAAVIEIGIDDVGAMLPHMELVRPTACLLTAIGPEHLEKLIDVETVAREELVSLKWTHEQKGVIAVNMDDPLISPTFSDWKQQSMATFSLATKKVDFYGEWDELTQSITVFESGQKSVQIKTPLPGIHNARNLVGAFAIARQCGMNAEAMVDGFRTHFEGAEGRSRWAHVDPLGIDVLCDYYNASPVSVAAALDVLQSHKSNGKKWIVLADMLELGPNELEFHTGLAPKIMGGKFDHVLLFGARMKALDESLHKLGFKGSHTHFESIEALNAFLLQSIQPLDCCLIKGSRSMKMERVWKALNGNR